MLELVKAVVPRSVRSPVRAAFDFGYAKVTRSWTSRSLLCDLRDAADWVLGRSDPLSPPRRLVFGIGGDLFVGDRFIGYFRELAGLRPDEAVLDVGCGVGRMALPLTRYLSPAGRYDGFDIVRANVGWCRKAITPRFPNFRFRHADVYNREYNPRGRLAGSTYRFPYPDEHFDFAFLTSVFTHLLPDTVAHYLRELGRVLRPGGRCLATVYLLNEESERLLAAGTSRISLEPGDGVYRVHSLAVPETCVALDQGWFRETARSAGLALDSAIHYGIWCGRAVGLDFQDVTILRK